MMRYPSCGFRRILPGSGYSVAAFLAILSVSGCATVVPQIVSAERVPVYPILLIHGFGARDEEGLVDHWGDVPETLSAAGVKVFLAGHDSFGTIEANAARLKTRIHEVLSETGAGKVNLVGHSKGGLESRYAVSSLECSPMVASITTIATPHRGTYIAEYYLERIPAPDFVGGIVDWFARLFGDDSPDIIEAARQLTPASMEKFNRENPDDPGVFYQSYAVGLTGATVNGLLKVPFDILEPATGPNDGIVPLSSTRWGLFRGIVCMSPDGVVFVSDDPDPASLRISHQEATGFGGFRINEFYIRLAEDLARRGF